MRMARLGAIAAVIVAVTMWMAPAWGQSQLFPVPGGVTSSPVGAGDPKMGGTRSENGRRPGRDGACRAARGGAAGDREVRHGPGQGQGRRLPDHHHDDAEHGVPLHEPPRPGFDVRKPQILVYEHHGNTWQLGALEWVFPKIPKTPPLPNATFGLFPAACHYADGTFIPDKNSNTCPKTAPHTGAKFTFWHPDLTTMHVWVWYPNPAGLYSSTNPLVTPFNAG
jgi:hypothetical protein